MTIKNVRYTIKTKMDYRHKLSVIIISMNEEEHIAECISSVLEATKDIDSEVILVDSASTDKTIDIARRYPIRILQSKPSWKLSSAAGRYLGFRYSSGEYVQFVDGDMSLSRKWVEEGISFLDKNNEAAGVMGAITQEYSKSPIDKRFLRELKKTKVKKPEEVKYFFGSGLFRSRILREVGSFNPHITAIEERELCDRISAKGYHLWLLPHHMCHHYVDGDYDIWKTWKKKVIYSIGEGQVFRLSFFNRIPIERFLVYKFRFLAILFSLFGLLSLFMLLIFGYPYPILLWLSGLFSLFFYYFLEEKDFRYAIVHSVFFCITWPFFIKGIFKQVEDPCTYPVNVKIIK